LLVVAAAESGIVQLEAAVLEDIDQQVMAQVLYVEVLYQLQQQVIQLQ
jgi:hypothetical protein